MLSKEIRQGFIRYFQEKGHAALASAPVVPFDDPTLLFNNAGMNQFKDIFLGKRQPDQKRAVTSQKCIRAGGKHNDLDNVGHTTRHLTFFEMLGNFSFGDYFKKETIDYAWDLSLNIFGLEEKRIWASVYNEDDEAFELWKKYLPEKRIVRFGKKQNFWAMGDVGPCGPCSEILYDRGQAFGDANHPYDDIKEERYLEYWNLVFMQSNQLPSGDVIALPKPSIDTGVGLERIVALKMGVNSVFETDVLGAIIRKIESLSGKKCDPKKEAVSAPFNVIADHVRCLSFAIADGAQPGNIERGYVLRKILRRAVRYSKQLGFNQPFLAKLLPTLIDHMGEDYPELIASKGRIEEILTEEEESFFRTLQRGGNLLQQVIVDAKKDKHLISGDDAFKLKDTYGLPLEEIELIATDANCTVDKERFAALEEEARERSRQGSKKAIQEVDETLYQKIAEAHKISFVGYDTLSCTTKVLDILSDGKSIDALSEGETGALILKESPFYAEMGGQVGDIGEITSENMSFEVTDTLTPFTGVTVHVGVIQKGSVKKNETVKASVNSDRRHKIEKNHTATHLLNYALEKVLGEHIQQAGSLVGPDRLRFDFNHHKAVSQEEIYAIEEMVNDLIRANTSREVREIPYAEAKEDREIKQFFGDKYGSVVRVVDFGAPKELCGGTHVEQLGTIGYFRIVNESSIAKGVRRIEALSGKAAEHFARDKERQLDALAETLKCPVLQLQEKVLKLRDDYKTAQTHLKALEKAQIKSEAKQLIEQCPAGELSVIITSLKCSHEYMHKLMDELKNQLKDGLIILGNEDQGRAFLACYSSQKAIDKGYLAKDLIKQVSSYIQGGGGGDAKRAQAGGKDPKGLPRALEELSKIFS